MHIRPLAISANQEVVATVVLDSDKNTGDLVVVREVSTEPTIAFTLPITTAYVPYYRMSLSPDGRYIAHLQRRTDQVVLTDISGTEPIEEWYLDCLQGINWLSYSPDGRHVAFGGEHGVGIMVVPEMELVWEWEAPGPVDWVEWADRWSASHHAQRQ